MYVANEVSENIKIVCADKIYNSWDIKLMLDTVRDEYKFNLTENKFYDAITGKII